MAFSFPQLPWLPDAPADFTPRRRALQDLDGEAFGLEGRRLATARLSAAQASALSAAVRRRVAAGQSIGPLAPVRLALVGGSTLDLLAEQVPAAALRHGVALDVFCGGYDQVEAAVLDPSSFLHAFRPDYMLFAVDHRWLRLAAEPGEAALVRLTALARVFGGTTPILCTVAAPPEDLFGNFDLRRPETLRARIAAFNAGLPAVAEEIGALVLDVAALAARVGADAWFDEVAWNGAKLAFAPAFDAAYAEMLGRLLGAARGGARKALVLDLDNTLWGGVLGDDGPEALKIGPGDPLGEAFEAVQAYALALHRRGVFLAVSSRNDDAAAREAFGMAPGMRLGLEHISVFQANWSDKASNLQAIARTLNVGVDALVLLDDNPAERAHVRAALPDVAVPELPEDPSLFVRTLSAAGYFEAVAFSEEDRSRARGRATEALRADGLARAGDIEDHLASLGMRLTVGAFDATSRTRVAQLINKTNQFNLTTRRRSEAEVAALEANPAVLTLQARLQDRFGDLGLIAVLIAEDSPNAELEVDTWLMSCRVLARGVEEAMFHVLTRLAGDRGALRITAEYRPTTKNMPVKELLPRLGFLETGNDSSVVRYAFDLERGPSAAPASIKIVRV